ncbi:MAG: hypothetical protein CMO80_03995 [Verrucomicrobiales bacterium]|nr:hypothetical protein [Verrucomicrobiales bacterium]
MCAIREGEVDPATFDTGLENAVRHFDGLHRALTGGEGFAILFDGLQPVGDGASMCGVVAGQAVNFGFVGGRDAPGPSHPVLRAG